ncbi:hypothetical protein ACFS6H_20020 [Terrimonas rubra]|uniref:Uncharacterized protein n=1 Tax=Terrimonas rubra TaxID=1035890 RepID=A0ABW6A9K4_9BACT
MKQIHSHFWFKENFNTKFIEDTKLYHCFGTCNGYDYSFASDNEESAWLLAEAYLKKNGHLFDERENQILALKDEIERNKNIFKKHMSEIGERHRSKLMSVYYMLDAISKTGTHREKQAVIVFQKCVLEDLINKGDTLPIEYVDELPF